MTSAAVPAPFPPSTVFLVIHGDHDPGHVSSTAFPLLDAAESEKRYWDCWRPGATRIVEAVTTYRVLDDAELQARAPKKQSGKVRT